MEDHWSWPIAIILLLSGLLLPAVRSAVFNGAAAVAVEDGALQRFAAPTLAPPVIDIAFEAMRSPLEIWHDKPLDAIQEKFGRVLEFGVCDYLPTHLCKDICFESNIAVMWHGCMPVGDW